MLPSLGIRNYRNLKSLDIERLARVNLIAGKNNTGKTSLLEAVYLYGAKGSIRGIDNLLKVRGEFYSQHQSTLENNLKTYSSLFHQRNRESSNENTIFIGPLEDTKAVVSNPEEPPNSLKICFIHMKEVTFKLKLDPEFIEKKWLPVGRDYDSVSESGSERRFALSISLYGKTSLDLMLDNLDRENAFAYIISGWPENLRFVRTYFENSNYATWSNIALTEKEDNVIQALRIIEPNVEKFAFVESNNQQKAVIKLTGNKERVPLQSMGDGMNRILTIILALVNAGDGYLLIDEFENGLHHKVQEDLWKMIFKLAKELNVQVFATTHSDDCIAAFEEVLNDNNQDEGLFIRLEKHGDTIKPVLFDAKELQVATDHEIEIR